MPTDDPPRRPVLLSLVSCDAPACVSRRSICWRVVPPTRFATRWLRHAPSVEGTPVNWHAQWRKTSWTTRPASTKTGALRVQTCLTCSCHGAWRRDRMAPGDPRGVMHESDVTAPEATLTSARSAVRWRHISAGSTAVISCGLSDRPSNSSRVGRRRALPLRVVLHGVDRTVARLTAKGPRRRPVRIEFCEADVRDADRPVATRRRRPRRRDAGGHAVISPGCRPTLAHARLPVVAETSRACARATVRRQCDERSAGGAERRRRRPPSATSTRASMRRVVRAARPAPRSSSASSRLSTRLHMRRGRAFRSLDAWNCSSRCGPNSRPTGPAHAGRRVSRRRGSAPR